MTDAPTVRPTFSVIIALRNKEQFVGEAIESVLSQRVAPLEILVIDDGSDDRGPDIVKSFDAPNLHLLRSKGTGPGPARNLGLEVARGEYCAFIDADDLWSRDHLAMLTETAVAFPRAGLISTRFEEFIGISPELGGERVANSLPRPFDYFAEQRDQTLVCTDSVAVRSSIARDVGGFGDFCPGEDQFLWQAIALRYPVTFLDHVTCYYRRDTDGIMEQAGVRSDAFTTLPPQIDQLEQFLAANPLNPNEKAIADYLATAWTRSLRQALLFQRSEVARRIIQRMQSRDIPVPAILSLLAHLPPPLLRFAMKLHAMRKGLFRAMDQRVSATIRTRDDA